MPKGERANLHTLSIEVTPEGDTEHKLQKMRQRQAGIDLGRGVGGGRLAKLETGSPRGKEELILGPCRRLMCPQQQGSGETEPDLSRDWACRPKDAGLQGPWKRCSLSSAEKAAWQGSAQRSRSHERRSLWFWTPALPYLFKLLIHTTYQHELPEWH